MLLLVTIILTGIGTIMAILPLLLVIFFLDNPKYEDGITPQNANVFIRLLDRFWFNIVEAGAAIVLIGIICLAIVIIQRNAD